MFLELLRKEFIERRESASQSVVGRVFSVVLKLLIAGCFIALESFITLSIDKKVAAYSSYGSFDFLVLFMFVMVLVSIIFTMVKARTVIFNRKDSTVIMPLPIPPSTQVLSKVVYLYAECSILELILATPLLFCYGITRGYIPYYYIFSILYPFLISISSVGISLLLSLLYQKIYQLIKKSEIAQFIVASALVVALCFMYKVVLDMFLTALSDSQIGGVFSVSFVNTLHKLKNYLLPVYSLLDAVIEKTRVASDILIFLGMTFLLSVIGIGSVSIAYSRVVKNENKNSESSRKTKDKPVTIMSPFKAMVKKELYLLFKDEGNLFSYTSLLIMAPFLTYAVISSLNSIIYGNLKFYAAYFPEIVSGINLMLILLFIGVINSSASMSMTREGKGIKIAKTVPVPLMKQIVAKIIIPLFFSELSLIITEIVLISFSVITVPVLFSSLFIGTLMLLFTNAFGIYADMYDKRAERSKFRMSLVNEMIPLALPIVIFLLFFVFSITTKIPSYALYLIGCVFSILVLSPFFFGLKKRYEKAFVAMEISN